MNGPLLRSRVDRKVAGVCGGLARAYGWDPTVVRIAVLLLAFFTGVGLVAYLICWVAMPEDPAGMPYPTTTYGGVPTQYPPYTNAPPPPPYPPYPPSDQPPTA